jgi:sulfide:quinone oxidoreductase
MTGTSHPGSGVEREPTRQPTRARADSGASHRARSTRRVVICGGGVASLETLLALRAHLKVGVEVHVVAPNRRFVYQPLAVAAPFDLAETHLLDLAEIVSDRGAQLHVDTLAGVDAENRRVRLAGDAELPYDVLVVAVGAQRRDWLEGALHFGGAASVGAFRALLERLENGSDRLVSFVNPAGVTWSLPLYELALLTASRVADRGIIGVGLTLVTPEADPLEVFGPAASRMLHDVLADRGIALRVNTLAERIHDGKLYLQPPGVLEADQVVTLARLAGPAVPGLPCDADGFISVDRHSRVEGLEGVYAAGDGTSFSVKQGGIAAQQADAAAEDIAAQFGAPVTPAPCTPTLRGMLLTGIAPTYLRAGIAATGGESFVMAANPLWWPPSKIAARYLAPYLAGHNALTRDQALEDRSPLARNAARLGEAHEQARELALVFAERDASERHFRSALEWLEVIERLDGVLPPGYLHKRTEWQDGERRSRS